MSEKKNGSGDSHAARGNESGAAYRSKEAAQAIIGERYKRIVKKIRRRYE